MVFSGQSASPRQTGLVGGAAREGRFGVEQPRRAGTAAAHRTVARRQPLQLHAHHLGEAHDVRMLRSGSSVLPAPDRGQLHANGLGDLVEG